MTEGQCIDVVKTLVGNGTFASRNFPWSPVNGAHITRYLEEDLHSMVLSPIPTVESSIEQTNLVGMTGNCLRFLLAPSFANED